MRIAPTWPVADSFAQLLSSPVYAFGDFKLIESYMPPVASTVSNVGQCLRIARGIHHHNRRFALHFDM